MIWNKYIFLTIFLFISVNIIIWYQLNSQLVWDWAKGSKSMWLMALMGVPISFLFIWATRYLVNGFEGLLWPTRFIGFGIGMVIYAAGVGYYFNEGINAKTLISLLLSVVLICIQVLWKN